MWHRSQDEVDLAVLGTQWVFNMQADEWNDNCFLTVFYSSAKHFQNPQRLGVDGRAVKQRESYLDFISWSTLEYPSINKVGQTELGLQQTALCVNWETAEPVTKSPSLLLFLENLLSKQELHLSLTVRDLTTLKHVCENETKPKYSVLLLEKCKSQRF